MISKQAIVIKKILTASNKKSQHNLKHVIAKRAKLEKSLMAVNFLSRKSKIEWGDIDGIRIAWITPLSEGSDQIIIYLHGGGFVYGLSVAHMDYVESLARFCKAKVLLIDYSLSPEAKFPVALDEIVMIWKHLLNSGINPKNVVLMGDSAGASLSISTVLSLRDKNIPQPARMVLFSPSVDMNMSEKSYEYNNDNDIILDKSIMEFFVDSYVDSANKTNPLASPLVADLHNLPSFLLQVGSDEVLLDECCRFVDKANEAGVSATLRIGEGMWHNWHLSAERMPESIESLKKVADFIAGN